MKKNLPLEVKQQPKKKSKVLFDIFSYYFCNTSKTDLREV